MAEETLADSLEKMSLFRPPIVRSAAAVLDRSLFNLSIPSAAAKIANLKNVSKLRNALGGTGELLKLDRFINIQRDPDASLADKGGKCLVLRPEVKPEDPTTWSSVLQEAVKAEELGVIPYTVNLDYNYWNYYDIMTSILPEDAQGEIPVGFAIVGHVAHLNLRDEYLPYKNVIAEVLLDKNPTIRTVINKIDDVGQESQFRTFSYEVLGGPDEMDVVVSEGDCTFRFDYSKVYWNSRLQTEHKRLVDMFKEGEVVVDIMAGVGPFAVPAGKRKVFVWANDLNPDSYASLKDNVEKNKVSAWVRPFCEDGHTFIHTAASSLLALAASKQNIISLPSKTPRVSRSNPPSASKPAPPPKTITIPPTMNHIIMNLPASALSFLPSFHGLYLGHEDLFTPHAERALPMCYVHCFSTKSADNVRECREIAARVGEELGVSMKWVGDVEGKKGDGEVEEGEVRVVDVREVAPKKRMFCAEFRLPREVAFGARRERPVKTEEVGAAE